MTERGQSEALGYALVFSIIVLTVALVTVSGQAGLTELRDSKRTANVEAGFSVLADNVDDVRGGVPSRATELDLSGGEMRLGQPISITVSAANDTGEVFDYSQSVRPIVYQAPDGTKLVYALGGVSIRGEGGGVAMLRNPNWLLTSNRTIVPVADTAFDTRQLRGASESVDSQSRVLVRTERRGQTTLASTDQTVTLTITVDSPRAVAWEDSLDAAIDPSTDDCSASGDSASCQYTTDRASVVVSRIAVSFE